MPTLKDQARWFIKNQWRSGRIPHPKTLSCTDCQEEAKEYDHYLGYEPEHWGHVQPVCRSCHHKRGYDRKERNAMILYESGNSFRDKFRLYKSFAEANPEQFANFLAAK